MSPIEPLDFESPDPVDLDPAEIGDVSVDLIGRPVPEPIPARRAAEGLPVARKPRLFGRNR